MGAELDPAGADRRMTRAEYQRERRLARTTEWLQRTGGIRFADVVVALVEAFGLEGVGVATTHAILEDPDSHVALALVLAEGGRVLRVEAWVLDDVRPQGQYVVQAGDDARAVARGLEGPVRAGLEHVRAVAFGWSR